MRWIPGRSRPAPRHLREADRGTAVSTWREAAYLAVLATLGGALLVCGFWVTGAGAIFDEAIRDAPASAPSDGPRSSTQQAPEEEVPRAVDVEGGPDLDPTD